MTGILRLTPWSNQTSAASITDANLASSAASPAPSIQGEVAARDQRDVSETNHRLASIEGSPIERPELNQENQNPQIVGNPQESLSFREKLTVYKNAYQAAYHNMPDLGRGSGWSKSDFYSIISSQLL